MMVVIALNPLGFHLRDALPKGNTFSTEYYRVNIFTELLPVRPQVDGRLVIHTAKARPHTARKCEAFSEEKRLRVAVHPPCSPDLAPPDSFLFGHINHCLQGITFHHVKNYLPQFMKSSRPSRDQSWRTYP
jgi:hypothetical protein